MARRGRYLRLACMVLASCLPLTAPAAAPATTWRCLLEGDTEAEWIRIGPGMDWREWRGMDWGDSSCTGHVAYSCRQADGVFYSETFSKVRDTRGTFRVLDRLDTRSGHFHRRVLDSTFILENGSQVEKNFYGHCEAGGTPPVDVATSPSAK